MRRLSRRWWMNIAAVNLALLSMFPAGSLAATGQATAEQTAGQTAGETIREKFGSQDTLQRNILNPMTSSETPMETVDGSISFPAQLSFPSSKKFLEIFMQPGPTGDLGTVIVGEDLDFDGTTEYSFQVPFQISGVCGNGVIACTPGTWTACDYYAWKADPSGKVSLQEASPDSLGGCYCLNNDCGSNLVWTNTPVILKDLGGGAVGAVQAANSGFTVSDVRVDTTTITYYGQDTSRQTTDGVPPGGSPTPPSQTAYYSDPLSLPSAAQSAAQAQAGDSESLYALVSGIDTHQQQNICNIRQQVTLNKTDINDVIVPLGGTGAVQYCGPDCIDVILGRIGNNYWPGSCTIYEENYRFFVKQPELIQSATLIRVKWDDYAQVWIGGDMVWTGPNGNFPPETPGACELSTEWDRNPNLDVTASFQQGGEVQTKIRVSVGGKGEGYAYIRVRLQPELCVASTAVVDGCASLAGRSDCTLQEEKVDGVFTIRNANPTNLAPLPSTKTLSEGGCSKDVTQDWWEKQRVYLCATAGYDFSDAKTRFGQVVGSLNDNGSSVSYQDMLRNPGGGWTYSSGELTLPDLLPADECEKACKTRRPKTDTQATLPGHSGQFRTDTDSFDILYHNCVNDECPAEPGEEVLKDCQCLNEFAEAATIMQMLRLAGQDTICSDGVAKVPSPR